MSCGRTETDEGENPALPAAVPASSTCVRCGTPPTILVRSTSYCHDCFLDVFQNKFKSGMDVARAFSRTGTVEDVKAGIKRGKQRSSVLLAFSGGPASSALLELMKPYLPAAELAASSSNPRYTPPPTFAGIEVVFVDESGVPGFEDTDRTEETRAIVEAAGFPFLALKLEDVFSSPGNSLSMDLTTPNLLSRPSTSSSTPISSLSSLLAPHSTTSRTALHSSLLHSLLRRTACSRSHELLVTGETATRIAIKTLAGMAEGRGWGMGEEVGASWEEGGLRIVRPLGLCLAKEVVYFGRAEGVEGRVEVRPGTAVEPRKAGIEKLTEGFVLGLEAGFPSTVSTIIRTAGKLGLRSADAQDRGVKATPCPLCGLPAQVGAQKWRTAITISSLIDSRALAVASATPPASRPAAISHAADSPLPTSLTSEIPLASLLCYGCLLVYQDIQQSSKPGQEKIGGIEVVLPPYVAEAAKRRWEEERDEEKVLGSRVRSQEEMRSIVQEFLLD